MVAGVGSISSPPSGPLAIGDLNGDGNPDVVALTIPSGSTGQSSVFINNGQGVFGAPNVIAVPYNDPGQVQSITLADFNRDGYTDVILFDYKQQLCIYLGNGDGSVPATPVPCGC